MTNSFKFLIIIILLNFSYGKENYDQDIVVVPGYEARYNYIQNNFGRSGTPDTLDYDVAWGGQFIMSPGDVMMTVYQMPADAVIKGVSVPVYSWGDGDQLTVSLHRVSYPYGTDGAMYDQGAVDGAGWLAGYDDDGDGLLELEGTTWNNAAGACGGDTMVSNARDPLGTTAAASGPLGTPTMGLVWPDGFTAVTLDPTNYPDISSSGGMNWIALEDYGTEYGILSGEYVGIVVSYTGTGGGSATPEIGFQYASYPGTPWVSSKFYGTACSGTGGENGWYIRHWVFNFQLAVEYEEVIFISSPITFATEEIEYIYTAVVNVDDSSFSFIGTTIPSWLSFDSTTASLSGTPTNDDVGEHDVVITVSNGVRTGIQEFTITVLNVNDPPILISSIDDATINEDEINIMVVSSLQEHFTDIDYGDVLSFSGEALSEGIYSMLIDNSVIVNTVQNYFGNLEIVFTATDQSGESVKDTMTLSVQNVNDPPYFNMQTSSIVDQDIMFSVEIIAGDVDSENLTFEINNQPNWLQLNGNIISGIASESGEFVFQISVTDGDTTIFTNYFLHVEQFNAVIRSIYDVPDDQGGIIFIQFEKSYFDSDVIYRSELYFIQRLDDEIWTTVGSSPALNESIYQVQVMTLWDSSSTHNGEAEHRVIAVMDEGTWISESAVGYSVDNIAPSTPAGLNTIINMDNIYLNWIANTDEDFLNYAIYRSTEDGFNPDLIEPTYITSAISLIDSNTTSSNMYYYRISAFDIHGNESNFSEQVEIYLNTNNENNIPIEYVLHLNYPNPFNPITTIKYDLPELTHVNIIIYDIMGREVKQLVNETLEAGFKSVVWNGTNASGLQVSAGMYLYQIKTSSGFAQTKKLVLLK